MPKRIVAPEVLAEARRLYEQTLAPVRDIAAMMGISVTYFYKVSDRYGWRRRQAKPGVGHFTRALSRNGAAALIAGPTEHPLRAPVEPAPPPATAEQRLVLARRLEEAVGEQIDAIKRVAQLVGDKGQVDLGARAAATLSRSLRETQELLQPPPQPRAENKPDDDDPVSTDIDEFRRELTRQLRGIIDARRARRRGGSDGVSAASKAEPKRDVAD